MWIVNKHYSMVDLNKFVEIRLFEDDEFPMLYFFEGANLAPSINIKFRSNKEAREAFDNIQLAIARGDIIFHINSKRR